MSGRVPKEAATGGVVMSVTAQPAVTHPAQQPVTHRHARVVTHPHYTLRGLRYAGGVTQGSPSLKAQHYASSPAVTCSVTFTTLHTCRYTHGTLPM